MYGKPLWIKIIDIDVENQCVVKLLNSERFSFWFLNTISAPITTGLNNAVMCDLLKPRVKCMRAPFVSVLPEKVAQDVEAKH